MPQPAGDAVAGRDRLLRLWSEALGVAPEAAATGSFIELGGYSLLALSLADRIRAELAVDVPREIALDDPDFETLWERLGQVLDSARPAAADEPRASAERTGDSFAMSDLQHAYVLGETGGFELGGPALFFEEYSCPPFDVERFRAAVAQLVERHGMLRADFGVDGTQSVPDTLPPCPVTFRSLRDLPAGQRERELSESKRQLCEHPPDLVGEANLAFRVFDCPQDEYRVQVCGRLLVFDGLSGEIFAEELLALLAGDELEPVGYTYAEYRRAAEQEAASDEYARARDYWMGRIDELPDAPQLPFRRASGGGEAKLVRRTHSLPADAWAAFQNTVRGLGLTPTAAVCAAFSEVLRHWSASQAFSINMMFGDRRPRHSAVTGIIGNFGSTMLVPCPPDGQTFLDRARELQTVLHSGLAHAAFSGVGVIGERNRRTGNRGAAAMPVVFASLLGVSGDDAGGRMFLQRLGWTRRDGLIRTPQVCFDHQVFAESGTLVVNWDTADELFADGVVEDMFADYTRLLGALATDPAAWHTESVARTPQRQLATRMRVNDTDGPTRAATLHGPFVARAADEPDRPAVITDTERITYRQLDEHARMVARALRARGVGPGDLVGVLAAKDWPQVAALLGTLYAGAAYVPVAPGWPRARRDQIIGSSGVRVLLSDRPTSPAVPEVLLAEVFEEGVTDAEAPCYLPDHRAYVLYTSGTTGEPKGVVIRHRAVANTIEDINERFAVGGQDRMLGVSDYTFDLSVYDVFGPLAVGGAVVLPAGDGPHDPRELHRLATAHDVTVWNSVPAYLGLLVDDVRAADRKPLDALRLALVSGDWVPTTLAADLRAAAPKAECVSLGGATEASIWSNYFPVPVRLPDDWVSVPYGFPLRNQRYAVLDQAYADRPDWVAGELYIAGLGLADGYLGNAEQTGYSFPRHPRTGERLYRTGDLARYWPDGTLEFLGREDAQVKINGFRVEPGEVEACLREHDLVADAAVFVRRDGSAGTLAAVVVPAAQTPQDIAAVLAAYAAEHLPAHLVPRTWHSCAALPLTGNGKVDRAALARMAADPGAATDDPAPPPKSETERRLATIWASVLGREVAAVNVDFFAAGGTSITAARLVSLIEREFGVILRLAALYEHNTIAAIAAVVDDAQPTVAAPLTRLAGEHGPPVVLIHPVGGDVLCYRALVEQLGGTARCYGIHADGSGDSIAALASRYADAVAELDGAPLRIVGWSFGGVVALEMARLLRERGRHCGAVLLDPWVPRTVGATLPEADVVRAFVFNLSNGTVELDAPLAGTHPEELLASALAEAGRSEPRLRSLTAADVDDLYATFASNSRALLGYRLPATVDGEVTVVEARSGLSGPSSRYLVQLRSALAGHPGFAGLRWEEVDGDHFVFTEPSAAPAIADLVLRAGETP